MSYVAIAGTVVSAGVGAYQASQSSKGGGGGSISSKSAGTVPKAAEYHEVHVGKEQLKTIWDNYKAMANIIPLTQLTNKTIDDDAMRRATRFIPGYKDAMDTYSRAGIDLLHGRLPFSDAMDIVSNRTDMTNSLGTPGAGGANATLKDLGVSRLSAIQSGGSILKDMVGIAETVNPVGRRMVPQSMFLSPTDRVNWAIQQEQLVQQSEQNKNNLAAAADPAAAQRSQLALAQAGQSAGAGGGYADVANSLIGGITGALTKSGTGTGGFSTLGAAQKAAPYAASYSSVPGMGYVPRASYYNGVVSNRY